LVAGLLLLESFHHGGIDFLGPNEAMKPPRKEIYYLYPGVHSASNRNEYQKHKNNNVSGE
jgi:hypothetical protein